MERDNNMEKGKISSFNPLLYVFLGVVVVILSLVFLVPLTAKKVSGEFSKEIGIFSISIKDDPKLGYSTLTLKDKNDNELDAQSNSIIKSVSKEQSFVSMFKE